MLSLPSPMLDEIIEHARVCAPREACGLLVGPAGEVARLCRVTNVSSDPHRYEMSASELCGLMIECDNLGWQFQVIYHSHPATAATPSPTDVELAFYPDVTYLIVSLQLPETPELGCFRIVDGVVSEELLLVNSVPA